MAEALKTFSFPVGGIADFYLEDHEKEALYKEKAQENFGSDGLGAIQDVAVRMASYGRYGDDKLVHAETGELVVPKALIDKNPKLKESIFGHLKDMGIEDPERYVVGTEANSINPDTGLPEFFLKDIFDKVGDVIRKVAPVVLPIALSFTPLGPVYGAALGSGVGSLIAGESLENSFKNALVAGAGGALTAGIGGAMGTAGFGGGVSQAFANPGARFAQLGQALTGPEKIFSSFQAPGTDASGGASGGSGADPKAGAKKIIDERFMNPEGPGVNLPKPQLGFGENLAQGNIKEAFFPQKQVTALDVINQNPSLANNITQAQNLADAANTRGFLSQNVGNIAAGTTLAAAGGFFDAPEVEDLGDVETGQDLIDKDRAKYIVANTDVIGSQPPFMVPTQFPFTPSPPIRYAGEGGEAFPRRTGGIGMDEGVKGKDSVRAMLMPGEFVMTTDAVNGAGNGDNEKGIKNMYAMMRSFEAKARA
jgi:hypothetical protein